MRPRILVVAGPTASGKTSLALTLAETLGGEIVGADSVQVFRGLDTGSAKPSLEERARVPHHLIDVRDPRVPWSAGAFVEDADRAIADVAARGHVPIVCGGTGLYLRSLLHGLAPSTPSCAATRARWEGIWREHGADHVHATLARVDPASADRIHPSDRVRVLRALEVHELTGRTISAWNAEHGLAERRYDALVLALTRPRADLHERAERRAAQMVRDGLLDEVRALLDDGVPPDGFALQTIGYREAVSVLAGDLDSDSLVERITIATRRYIRRQLVFLRGQLRPRWVRAEDDDGPARTLVGAVVDAWTHRDEARVGWATEAEALGIEGSG